MEDFKKFDLNENPPTVATDNTLPLQQKHECREFRITKNFEDGTPEVTHLEINGEKWVNEKDMIDKVIQWMNEWDQLRYGPIPIRFKEDFSRKLTP